VLTCPYQVRCILVMCVRSFIRLYCCLSFPSCLSCVSDVR